LVMEKSLKSSDLKKWRRRGFYSETVLVKKLQRSGYNAVRVPVSNPSLRPLPDVIARRDRDVYAFEVKNASYYAYFPKKQIDKLFRFLHELIPLPQESKHAILAAHLGKKWIFRRVPWDDWEKDRLAYTERIVKNDKGNFKLEKGRSAES
jgi:Holliday junction resolvase